jgi:cell division protein FtsW
MRSKGIDKTFLLSVILLVAAGFFIFSSASLGLLAREGISYSGVAIKQFIIGFVVGGLVLVLAAKIPYKFWRSYAFYFLLASLILCCLVFIPQIGFSHGGARRWINIGQYTFQPAELLKLGVIIYFAAMAASAKEKIKSFKSGALPLFILLGITGILLLNQPDTGTFLVIISILVSIFISAGGRWRYLLLIIGIGILGILILAQVRPYFMNRLTTFLDPSQDALGSGYQIQQSLIAIGSGGFFGRGFGQSIQKFNFLPEPIGDSIFAVAAEEFGFIGALTLILLFLFFALRGYKISSHISDPFAKLVVIGIITHITTQSFINIGAMLGVLPLTGVPLVFVSHGGTAMLLALAEVGIVLNISKSQKT